MKTLPKKQHNSLLSGCVFGIKGLFRLISIEYNIIFFVIISVPRTGWQRNKIKIKRIKSTEIFAHAYGGALKLLIFSFLPHLLTALITPPPYRGCVFSSGSGRGPWWVPRWQLFPRLPGWLAGNGSSAFREHPSTRTPALRQFPPRFPPQSRQQQAAAPVKISNASVKHFRRGRRAANFRWQPGKYLHIWYLCSNNFIHHVEFPYRFCPPQSHPVATFLVIFHFHTGRKEYRASLSLFGRNTLY